MNCCGERVAKSDDKGGGGSERERQLCGKLQSKHIKTSTLLVYTVRQGLNNTSREMYSQDILEL